MAKTQFEKHITKYEVANQCFMLESDDGKTQYSPAFKQDRLMALSEHIQCPATIRDFYVKGAFKKGIAFDHEKGHLNPFFFENSVSEGKRVVISYDDADALIDGRLPVNISIYIKTKES